MRLLALLLVLLGLPVRAAEDAGPYSFTLSGKAFDERCLRLVAGETIRYRFRASAPVDFNIHYHRGNDIHFPVKRPAVRDIESTFVAPRADGYCLMWEHRGKGVASVEGNVERMPPR